MCPFKESVRKNPFDAKKDKLQAVASLTGNGQELIFRGQSYLETASMHFEGNHKLHIGSFCYFEASQPNGQKLFNSNCLDV